MASKTGFRSKHQIMRDILGLLMSGPQKKYHVLSGALVNNNQLEEYSKKLFEQGLMVENEHHKLAITPKGREYIKQFDKTDSFVNLKEKEAKA